MKKELNIALITELDERKVAVIPVLYRDCKLPAFLREKKYADFRTSFTKGLMEVRLAIAPELFAERQKRFLGKTVGLDFGTTNSLVAVMENGSPRILANFEGSKSTPSVAALTPDGEWIAGLAAVAQSGSNPHRTFVSIKSHFGTDFVATIDGKEYRPVDIAAIIFRKLRLDAERNLGKDVRRAVLTCPARFSQRQRADLRTAAGLAGFEVLRLISEPTAALLAYGYHHILSGEHSYDVAVYDLGGGSFDIAIAQPDDGVVEVKAVWGDTHLGGDDFDNRLFVYCADWFQRQYVLDLRADAVAVQRLRREVEAAKIVLSSASSVRIFVPFIAVAKSGAILDLDVSVSRNEFQAMTRDLVEKSIENCRRAFADLDYPPFLHDVGGRTPDPEKGRARIKEVILCGLSTKMPAVRGAVREAFGRVPVCRVDPDEVVALGAAIQGAVLEGLERGTLLLDMLPISLGVELKDGTFLPILHRQTTLPYRKITDCTAELSEAELVIKLYEGEAKVCTENTFLCVLRVAMPNHPTERADFSIVADIDANGLIHIEVSDTNGNQLAKKELISEVQRLRPEGDIKSNIVRKRPEEKK